MALSRRLQQLDNMVSAEYTHIWDCCCDHGLLGFSLLSRNAASTIHFVDIVPELMAELDSKLQRFYPESGLNSTNVSQLSVTRSWITHCLDVSELPLNKYQGKHLIIIAGVGGDLMIKFIESIHQSYQGLTIDFLLCPVHHQFSLRSKLIDLDFSLQDEVLVEDNKRFYEIILVSSSKDKLKKISPVGDKIWQVLPNSKDDKQLSKNAGKEASIAEKYLAKTLEHYQRIQRGNTSNDVQAIIDAYQLIVPIAT